MKILVVSQYFWPERFAINEVVLQLSREGHEVLVATGKPGYPEGETFEGYSAWGFQREHYQGRVEVLRLPVWPRAEGGRSRLLNHLSFVVGASVCLPWLLRKREFDAILVFAPAPLTQALPALILKKLKKVPLCLWLQELWPDPEAPDDRGGTLKRWLSRRIFQRCDQVAVCSRAYLKPLEDVVASRKLSYLPIPSELPAPSKIVPLNAEVSDLLAKHFCVVFACQLGTSESLETVVQVATHLRDDPRIRVLMAPRGSRVAWLRAQQHALELSNLVLLGPMADEAVLEMVQQASALLVSFDAESSLAALIPPEVARALAAGKPVVASMDGEGARAILDARAGLASAAEQVLPLVANVRCMAVLGDAERAAMGRSGRAYYDAHFAPEASSKRLLKLLGAGE